MVKVSIFDFWSTNCGLSPATIPAKIRKQGNGIVMVLHDDDLKTMSYLETGYKNKSAVQSYL